MPAITLYQYSGFTRDTTLSPPSGKAVMALRFKKLDFKLRNVSPLKVKKVNPRGRVPALEVDGAMTVDSTDILTELDRLFPDPPLEPEGALARARGKILEDWADEVLYFYLVYLRWVPDAAFARQATIFADLPIPMRWLVPTFARREARARLRGQGTGLKDEATVRRELRACLDALAALIDGSSGPFLLGDRPTRADLSVCAVIDQMRHERITPELALEIADDFPSIATWTDHVHQHAGPAC